MKDFSKACQKFYEIFMKSCIWLYVFLRVSLKQTNSYWNIFQKNINHDLSSFQMIFKEGFPVRRMVGGQRTLHVTLLPAVTRHHGIFHLHVIQGGDHKIDILEFTSQLIQIATEQGLSNPWIVFDNAPVTANWSKHLELTCLHMELLDYLRAPASLTRWKPGPAL